MAEPIPDIEELRKRAVLSFEQYFGQSPTVCACAPGRVNLIGEHTDYNDGFVLPMALPLATIIAGKANGGKQCKIITVSDSTRIPAWNHVEFEYVKKTDLRPGTPEWANYVKGAIHQFHGDAPAFDAAIVSSVPMGAGLSSSAALEVAVYTFLEGLTGNTIDKKEKAVRCQKAEHEFAGVPCGIMDQLISVMGSEGHGLLIDCRSLVITEIPINIAGGYVFLIVNSNSPHKLTGGEYSKRRDACKEAAEAIGRKSLRDATIQDIEKLKSSGVPEQTIRYATHVITEIQRTLDASESLKSSDYKQFGLLMNDSHSSLKNDYHVSSEDLDRIVNAANTVSGVLGSRLTGAGFGGCTVTLVKKEAVDDVIRTVREKYPGKPTFYIATPAQGARLLPVD